MVEGTRDYSPCSLKWKVVLHVFSLFSIRGHLVFVFKNTKNTIYVIFKNCSYYLNLVFFYAL